MPISLLTSNSQSLQVGAVTPQDARPVKDSPSTQDADSPPGTEPTTGGTSEASSIVTLSPAAQIIASANAKNIEFSTTSLLVVSGAPEAAEVANLRALMTRQHINTRARYRSRTSSLPLRNWAGTGQSQMHSSNTSIRTATTLSRMRSSILHSVQQYPIRAVPTRKR
jgi:hypothetical protein